MKRTIIAVLVITLLTACQPQGYIINGTLTGAFTTGTAYIEYPSYMDGPLLIDSTKIIDGKFQFQGEVEKPALYHILIDVNPSNTTPNFSHQKLQSTIYIDNSNITYTANISALSDSSCQEVRNIEITGSPTHDYYLQLHKKITAITDSLKLLRQCQMTLKENYRINSNKLQNNLLAQEEQKERLLELLTKDTSSIVSINQAISLLSDKSLSLSAKQIEILVGQFKRYWSNTAEMVALEFTAAMAYPISKKS